MRSTKWRRKQGKTVPQIALNWLLQRPTVANVIIGARNEEQLRQNLGAVGWNLTPEQVAKLDAASELPAAYPYWHQVQFADRNLRRFNRNGQTDLSILGSKDYEQAAPCSSSARHAALPITSPTQPQGRAADTD